LDKKMASRRTVQSSRCTLSGLWMVSKRRFSSGLRNTSRNTEQRIQDYFENQRSTDRYPHYPVDFVEDTSAKLLSRQWFCTKLWKAIFGFMSFEAGLRITQSERYTDAKLFHQLSTGKFLSGSEDLFKDFVEALTTGQLQQLATDELSSWYSKYPISLDARKNPEQVTTITGFYAPPQLMNCSVVGNSLDPKRGGMKKFQFGVITVRLYAEAVERTIGENKGKRTRKYQPRRGAVPKKCATSSHLYYCTRREHPYLAIKNFDRPYCGTYKRFEYTPGEYDYLRTEWFYMSSFLSSFYSHPRYFIQTPKDSLRGTLGASGKVVAESTDPETDSKMYRIEYVVHFQRPLFRPQTPWRVSYF